MFSGSVPTEPSELRGGMRTSMKDGGIRLFPLHPQWRRNQVQLCAVHESRSMWMFSGSAPTEPSELRGGMRTSMKDGGIRLFLSHHQWQHSREACQKNQLNGQSRGLHSTLMYSEVGR